MTLDEHRWIALFRLEMPKLYRTVSRAVGGDRALAEDTVQETWLRAVRAWEEAGLPQDAGSWLTTVAMNLLRNHFRDKGVSSAAMAEIGRDATSSLTDPPVSDSAHDDARRAATLQTQLARLPEDQATILHGRYFEGLNTEQLAVRHRTTARGVEGRLRRARGALARLMNA